ncbi:MAG: hypothetical protein NDI69_03305 [Bacteriovoracaceae bacterium]|nr:hypothetical protein [Bacteriovoracaceae bacterium]
MKKQHLILGALLCFLSGVGVKLKNQKSTHTGQGIDMEVVQKKIRKITKRQPASASKSQVQTNKSQLNDGTTFDVSERKSPNDISSFNNKEQISHTDSSGTRNGPQVIISERVARNRSSGPGPTRRESSPSNDKAPQTNPSKSESSAPLFLGTSLNPNINLDSDNEDDKFAENSTTPTCSSTIAGGSFKTPISVGLSCSTASTIRYCLSENTCCDPDMGSLYTGPISFGQQDKSFCLSFSGTSNSNNETSATTEASYYFNPALPHLLMTSNKIQKQTTQLKAKFALSSNDFGSSNHFLGILNLRDNDPTSMNCTDIIDTYSSTSSWSGLYAMPEMPVTSLSASTDFNVAFNLGTIVYGDNNLVGYMRSNLYSDNNFACSMTKLTLNDFYYSQDLSIDVLPSADQHELMGGFTAMSPVDETPLIYRGPASDIDSPEQELRTGLLSMFYDL